LSVFRRGEPLHVRLAREAGLQGVERPPHDPGPRWGEVGIHGVSRPREWDAVVAAEAPRLGGGELEFVVLPDGTLVVDDELDLEPGSLDPLAAALEAELSRPYRASAVWRGGSRWGVAGRQIEVAELPRSVVGDEIVLSVADGAHSLVVDGAPSFGSVPALERIGAARGGTAFVIRAERLADLVWEIEVGLL
jgi:hypothetical protein